MVRPKNTGKIRGICREERSQMPRQEVFVKKREVAEIRHLLINVY